MVSSGALLVLAILDCGAVRLIIRTLARPLRPVRGSNCSDYRPNRIRPELASQTRILATAKSHATGAHHVDVPHIALHELGAAFGKMVGVVYGSEPCALKALSG